MSRSRTDLLDEATGRAQDTATEAAQVAARAFGRDLSEDQAAALSWLASTVMGLWFAVRAEAAHDRAHVERLHLNDGRDSIEHLRTLGHEVPDGATYEDIAELFGWGADV